MWKIILGGAVGLVAGAVLGYIGKCRSGACPLTGNPYTAALLGGLVGVIIAMAWGGRGSGGSLPTIADTGQFRQKVLQADQPVVVEFYADWCGWCHKLEPTLAALANEYGDKVRFVKVNFKKLADLSKQYQIEGVPTCLLLVGGAEAHRWVGTNRPRSIARSWGRSCRNLPRRIP